MDLTPAEATVDSSTGELDLPDSLFLVKQVEFLDMDMTHFQIGDSIVTFLHHRCFPSIHDHPVTTFQLDTTSHQQCVIYHDMECHVNYVS